MTLLRSVELDTGKDKSLSNCHILSHYHAFSKVVRIAKHNLAMLCLRGVDYRVKGACSDIIAMGLVRRHQQVKIGYCCSKS
jgi:hypothetical protein